MENRPKSQADADTDSEKGTYVQISGMDGTDNIDDFQREEIHSIIDRTVKKIGNITPVKTFSVHLKTYKSKTGKPTKYSVRLKVLTKNGLVALKEHGWDVIDVFSKITNKLEKILISSKAKLKKNSLDAKRLIKYKEK